MPEDLRRSWCNNNRNEVHAKCNAHGCVYTNMLMLISQFVPPGSRKLLQSSGSLLGALWWPRGVGSGRVGGRPPREGIFVYTWLAPAFAWQKRIQHCKIIIFQFKQCNILDSSQNHPTPDLQKDCLPWNWSLVPKMLGTAALGHRWQKKAKKIQPKHNFLVLEYGTYQYSNFFSNNAFSRFLF